MFKAKRKKQQEILDKQKSPKTHYFDFDRISLFFSHMDKTHARQVISRKTLDDIDFEALFMQIDRTTSSVGQQYLYASLRNIPNDDKTLERMEALIELIENNPEKKEHAILALHKLSEPGGHYIQRLIFEDALEKPSWFWFVQLLSAMSLIALPLMFFYPVTFLLALPVFAVNLFIHFWNKNNLLDYSNTIPQLFALINTVKKLDALGLITQAQNEVSESLKSLQGVARSALFFKWESKASDELGQIADYAFDLIKGAFLLEPILFFRLLKHIKKQKEAIHLLFETTGKIDVAISVATWRASLPYYSKPTFSDEIRKLETVQVYHPLIEKPIANDLALEDNRSILLSGSNMSGKTTFIRTIGINALLAQTIHTVCAKSFELSRFDIYSAIRISDDILHNTSYYYEEIKTVKRLIEASETSRSNLFLLDELFKGTNTVERISSGKAVLSHLHNHRNIVFCSTHDLELMDFLSDEYRYYHFSETIELEQLKFDYSLKEGRLQHTNAIRLLELNHFPERLTEEAKTLAHAMHQEKRLKSKVS